MKNTDVITISEGLSNAYLVHGCVPLLLSLPFIGTGLGGVFGTDPNLGGTGLVMLAIGGALFYLALALFLSSTGTQINKKTKEWRSYTSFLGYTMGKWCLLPDLAQELQLKRERSISTRIQPRTMGNRTTDFVGYEIFCIHSGNQELLLYEFTDYKAAYTFLELLGAECQLPVWDQVEEQRKMAFKRRAQRGRR